MLTEENKRMRELVVRPILRAKSEQFCLRTFRIPRRNFTTKDYTDLIDWPNIKISEPPILANTAVTELEMFVASGDVPVVYFSNYRWHTEHSILNMWSDVLN